MSDVLPDVVKLAGGATAVAKLADQRVVAGKYAEALRLVEAALTAEPSNADALRVRLQALEKLKAVSRNSNERGWLDYSIRTTRQQMQ